ncbi:MAG: ACP S-malonyltransferase [Gammaproteobacteria bacterium]
MTIAFLFPGQGSQSVGMLNGYTHLPEVRALFDRANNALGYDLLSIIQHGPAEELNKTEITQPAILAVSYAFWLLYEEEKALTPSVLAGHSLGEYTAYVAAGAIAFEDALKLVARRGALMQAAVPEGQGAMAAILGMDDESVRTICDEVAATSGVVSAVNFNSPGQVVIAGSADAVAKAVEVLKDRGAKRAMMLPVSVPSHCALMKPAAEKFREDLAAVTIQAPVIPVINNVDVATVFKPEQIRDSLVRQLYSPVRWSETVKKIEGMDVVECIECGPGKVLSGLHKRIVEDLPITHVLDHVSPADLGK